MTAPNVQDSDATSIRTWFETMHKHVADVNFTAATPLFHKNATAFGTYKDIINTRDDIIAQQWRSIWPTIEKFAFTLELLTMDVSPDRLLASGVVPWGSNGFHEDGTTFDRPGRATIILRRDSVDAPWQAVHSHFSLNPNTPQRSYGDRPEMT